MLKRILILNFHICTVDISSLVCKTIINYISKPWPWYLAGLLIGFVIVLLQWIDNKPLAASSSYRHMCAAAFSAGVSFLKYNWKAESRNLFFVIGIFIAGFLAAHFLTI
jgi:uncharacterized membrane protein